MARRSTSARPERSLPGDRRPSLWSEPVRIDLQGVAVGDDHGPFDKVLQLAHVPRPGILHQEGPCRGTDGRNGLAHPPAEGVQEVPDQVEDVFAAVAERWDMNGKHVQAKEQVGSKAPLAHGDCQVSMRGRDEAHVHGQRLGVANSFDGALLQDSQEHHLDLRRQFTDFIEKDCPLIRQLQAADAAAHAPVKAPGSCPNNSLAMTPGARAAQLTATRRRSRRELSWWMARATNSFPVPVSPQTRTVLSVRATCWTARRTAFIGRLSPVSKRRSRSARDSSRR